MSEGYPPPFIAHPLAHEGKPLLKSADRRFECPALGNRTAAQPTFQFSVLDR